jgi:hypothetical protein
MSVFAGFLFWLLSQGVPFPGITPKAAPAGPTLIASGCWAVGIGASGALDTTGANLIVVGWVSDGSSTLGDSKSNSYTSLTNQAGLYGNNVQLHYTATSPTVGASHTWQITNGAGSDSLCVEAWSGATQPAPFETGIENGAASGTTVSTLATGSITPTNGIAGIVVTVTGTSGTPHTHTVDSSMSTLNNGNGAGTTFIIAMASKVQPTGGAAINPTWSFGGTVAAAVAIAAFK